MPLRLNHVKSLASASLASLASLAHEAHPPITMPSCLYESLSSCVHSHPKSAGFQVHSVNGSTVSDHQVAEACFAKSERDFVAALSAHSKVSKSTRISFSTRMWLEAKCVDEDRTGTLFKLHCYFSSGTRCARCNPSLDHWSKQMRSAYHDCTVYLIPFQKCWTWIPKGSENHQYFAI